MRVRFNLKEPNGKDKTLVLLVIRYRGFKLVWSTGFFIDPADWNKQRMRPKSGRLAGMRDQLNSLERIAEEIYYSNDAGALSKEEFKELLDIQTGKRDPAQEKTPFLLEYVKLYLERIKGEIGKGRMKGLKATRNHLRNLFPKDIRLDAIDWAAHRSFVSYLKGDNPKGLVFELSYINRNLGNLSQFMSAALADGHHANHIHTSKQWNLKANGEKSKEVIALTLAEVQDLARLDGLTAWEKRVRDWYLIGFLTGQRWSDFSKYAPHQFKDGLLEVRQGKTKKLVKVPLDLWTGIFPVELTALLEQYDYTAPKMNAQKFNVTLRELCRRAGMTYLITVTTRKGGELKEHRVPKYTKVTSHTARRSFATALRRLGFAPADIMPLTGHSSEDVLRRYIGMTEEENAELARLKMRAIKERKSPLKVAR
mgnify:CR=1 FL=1